MSFHQLSQAQLPYSSFYFPLLYLFEFSSFGDMSQKCYFSLCRWQGLLDGFSRGVIYQDFFVSHPSQRGTSQHPKSGLCQVLSSPRFSSIYGKFLSLCSKLQFAILEELTISLHGRNHCPKLPLMFVLIMMKTVCLSI